MSKLKTEIARELARAMKIARLRGLPGMDSVAVALNSEPTYHEIQHAESIITMLESLGCEIRVPMK